MDRSWTYLNSYGTLRQYEDWVKETEKKTFLTNASDRKDNY